VAALQLTNQHADAADRTSLLLTKIADDDRKKKIVIGKTNVTSRIFDGGD